MFEPWVGKDPLEKEMASHSSTLALKIPWTEATWGRRVGLSYFTSLQVCSRLGHNFDRNEVIDRIV